MSAVLHLRRNVVTTVTAFFVNVLLTFVGFRLVVHQGGTEALGLWSALTAAIYVIRLGDVGMSSAAERHVAATDASVAPYAARGYLDTALVLNAILFVGLAVAGWVVLSGHIGWVVPDNAEAQAEALRILPLVLVGFVMSNLANVVSGGLRGLHLGWQAAYLSVAGGLLQLGIIVALVPRLGIAGLAWAQLAQNTLIGLVAWRLFNSHLARQAGNRLPAIPRTGSRKIFRELFSFSVRAQAVNLANGLLEPASKLMVGHSAGMSVLGLFEMAYKIVALPRNAVVSGVLGMIPAMTRLLVTEPDEAARLYRRARRMVALGSGAVLALVVVGSPVASTLLLGQVDQLLMTFVAIMAVGFWLNAIGAPAYALGFASGRMGVNQISALLALGGVIALGLTLQMISPTHGPVIASSVALAFGGLYILWGNQRLLLGP